jgi:hypothetical protein
MAVEGLPEKINPLDRMLFKMGMKGIHENFDGISEVLNASRSNRTAFMYLRRLMAATYTLGQSSVVSPKMKKVFLNEIQAVARDANTENAKARKIPLKRGN